LPRDLTPNQRNILQQIHDLDGKGYLEHIRRSIKLITGKDISPGRASDLLMRMERRSWVESKDGHIETEWKGRGGCKAKGKRYVRLYRILPGGVAALGVGP